MLFIIVLAALTGRAIQRAGIERPIELPQAVCAIAEFGSIGELCCLTAWRSQECST